MASSSGQRMSREDFKKAKELEELRKTGAAPPEMDEEGKMINPHIPQYISSSPWYIVTDPNRKTGLKHQRQSHFGKLDTPQSLLEKEYFKRGLKDKVQSRWVKGACENCGATTHKKADCLDRPRKIGARFNNSNIKPDEIIPDASIQLDFEGKRDRWNGWDSSTYSRVIEHHQRTEEARREVRSKEIDEQLQATAKKKEERRAARRKRKEEAKQKKKEKKTGGGDGGGGGDASEGSDSDSDGGSDSDSDSDLEDGEEEEDKEMKDAGMSLQNMDEQGRATVRNLRIREDTAKYLYNLDVNSSYYDPKTRSMRENPHTGKDAADALYTGDNFVRFSGDVNRVNELQSFVWEAHDRGNEEINVLANPSQAEKMFADFQSKKAALKDQKKSAILDAYGGREHLESVPAQLRLGETEAYVEYSEDGRVVKGQEEAVPKTKYAEDVLELNHSAVWGSYYRDGKWGYGCCHQLVRNAYCIGKKGLKPPANGSAEASDRALMPPPVSKPKKESAADGASAATEHKEKAKEAPAQPKKTGLEGLSFEPQSTEPGAADAPEVADGQKKKKDSSKRKRSSSSSGSSSSSSSSSASSSSSSSESGSDSDSGSDKARSKKQKDGSASKKEAMERRRAERAKRKERALKKAAKTKADSDSSSSAAKHRPEEWKEDWAKRPDIASSKKAGKGYNVVHNVSAPTEEEMEAYMKTKVNADDPMAAILGRDDVLPDE